MLGPEILESSCIAWPNPSMWRRAPFALSMPVPSYPSDDPDSHAHSPRRRADAVQGHVLGFPISGVPKPPASFGMRRVTHPTFGLIPDGKGVPVDSFGDVSAYFEWLSTMGMGSGDATWINTQGTPHPRVTRKSSTDISMPDYTPFDSDNQLAATAERPIFVSGVRQEEDDASGHMTVPTNTPTASGQADHEQDGTSRLPPVNESFELTRRQERQFPSPRTTCPCHLTWPTL